jgi:antitoxin MazE
MPTTTISRWGNSLAIRIPKDAAEQAHLHEGDVVKLVAEAGRLSLVANDERSLDELIAMVSSENLHSEEFDKPIGAELW